MERERGSKEKKKERGMEIGKELGQIERKDEGER